MGAKKLYKEDFYSWINYNIKQIKDKNNIEIDFSNLLKELIWMSKKEKKELRNRLKILMGHMLKWDYQPEYRGRSWCLTIKEQRKEIQYIIDESPSLKSKILDYMKGEFENAVEFAMDETRLKRDDFPEKLLYSKEDLFEKTYEMPDK